MPRAAIRAAVKLWIDGTCLRWTCDYIVAPTEGRIEDPRPIGLPEMLTAALVACEPWSRHRNMLREPPDLRHTPKLPGRIRHAALSGRAPFQF